MDRRVSGRGNSTTQGGWIERGEERGGKERESSRDLRRKKQEGIRDRIVVQRRT